MKDSTFPYIVANIQRKKDGSYLPFNNQVRNKIFNFKAKEVDIRIGVIGLATKETVTTTSGSTDDWLFDEYTPIILQTVKDWRTNNQVDAIVLWAHFGPQCWNDGQSKYEINIRDSETKQEGCNENIEYNILMKKLGDGVVDAVVAGHVHDVSHHWISGVPVIETNGPFYSHVLYLPFSVNQETKEVKLEKTKIQIEGPLPTCEKIFTNTLQCDFVEPEDAEAVGPLTSFSFHKKPLTIDEKLKSELDPWREWIEKNWTKVVYNEELLETKSTEESILGNLITDITRKVTGADIALFNLGGLRTKWYRGILNEIDMFNMFPFNNTLVTFEMKGFEWIRMLKQVQSGYSFNLASGLLQLFTDNGEKVKWIDAKLFDGLSVKTIELEKDYIVCLNDFLANGGSSFKKVMEWYKMRNRVEYGLVRDYVKMYLKKIDRIRKKDWINDKYPRVRFSG